MTYLESILKVLVVGLILGAGLPAITIPGVGTLADAARFHLQTVERLGEDVLLTLLR